VPTILYLGRLKPYKRIDLLLRAFAALRPHVTDARLSIAGRGEDDARLRELAVQLELGESVVFEGFVDETRKRQLLQEAWVCATPSLMEGWGISVIEANACGTPAVAFDVPGLREAIVDQVSGVIVSAEGDLVGGLATALRAVLTDARLREALARGAVERAASFSWEAATDAMLAIVSQQFIEADSGVVLNEGVWHLPQTRHSKAERAPEPTRTPR
jgi:glycosyltransferase involved in cell wall biosynthesis